MLGKRIVVLGCICFGFIVSCSKKETTSNCIKKNIQIQTTASNPCKPTGKIVINVQEVTDNLQYCINQLAWQQNNTFNNVAFGKNLVSVMDANGCVDTVTTFVSSIAAGTLFSHVKTTLSNYCLGCHNGLNPQAGLDFTNNCDIINHAIRIRERAVFGNPTPMPQMGLMPLEERNKIINWINAGAGFDN